MDHECSIYNIYSPSLPLRAEDLSVVHAGEPEEEEVTILRLNQDLTLYFTTWPMSFVN